MPEKTKDPIVIDAKYHREWRLRNPESFKRSQEKYKNSEHGKNSRRERFLSKVHGLTVEEYDLMLIKQGHKCAICNVHQSELKKTFDIDHSHTTGKIRGLLCNSCNQAIGLMDDSIGILSKAIDYLEKTNG